MLLGMCAGGIQAVLCDGRGFGVPGGELSWAQQ